VERRWNWWLRVVAGLGFLAVAAVTMIAMATAGHDLAELGCDPRKLVMCARPGLVMVPPPPDWTAVVALAAIGVVLLWPRHRREADPAG